MNNDHSPDQQTTESNSITTWVGILRLPQWTIFDCDMFSIPPKNYTFSI